MPQTLSTLSSDQMTQYERDGFLILREFLAADEVAEIRDAFMKQIAGPRIENLFDDHRVLGPDDPLKKYPRLMHPHRYPDQPVGPVAMKYILERRIANVLRDLFADEPIAAQSMFYYKPPGARGQDLHQDNFYLRVKPGTCMAAWIAIDDADRENGGMIAARGSHTEAVRCPEKSDSSVYFTTEHVEPPPGAEIVPLDLKAGDCLFFNGSLIHGSFPNGSRRFRRAFICHYVPAGCVEVSHWYRPLLNFEGVEVSREQASGGGPCGTVQSETGPH